MDYINPENVISPQKKVSNVQVIFDGVETGLSLARLELEGDPAIGIRWNGGPSNLGTPQSHGNPTWFILPKEFDAPLLQTCLQQQINQNLAEGYLQMAADTEREQEAYVWSESLVWKRGSWQSNDSSEQNFLYPFDILLQVSEYTTDSKVEFVAEVYAMLADGQ